MELPSFLFGTIHYPFDNVWSYYPEKVERSFNQSKFVVLEIDLLEKQVIARTMMKYIRLQRGKQLTDVIDKDVYANVATYIEKLLNDKIMYEPHAITEVDILLSHYDDLKPYWVGHFLQSMMVKNNGTSDHRMLDATLAYMAKAQNKSMQYIETPEEQFSALSRVDEDGFGEFFLNSTVNFLQEDKAFYEKGLDSLLIHYLCGTTFTHENILREYAEDKNDMAKQFRENFLEKVVRQRNRLWLPRIDQILRSHTQVFLAFGAGHMVGEDSVVELLRREGYTVTLYTNDDWTNGEILPVSNNWTDRSGFEFFTKDFGTPSKMEYSVVSNDAPMRWCNDAMMNPYLWLLLIALAIL
ncbi:traB family domain-containing protein [Ditylenchus destructor]|nr:traB family domain-containing protein [Ditylenchus destructor]